MKSVVHDTNCNYEILKAPFSKDVFLKAKQNYFIRYLIKSN